MIRMCIFLTDIEENIDLVFNNIGDDFRQFLLKYLKSTIAKVSYSVGHTFLIGTKCVLR